MGVTVTALGKGDTNASPHATSFELCHMYTWCDSLTLLFLLSSEALAHKRLLDLKFLHKCLSRHKVLFDHQKPIYNLLFLFKLNILLFSKYFIVTICLCACFLCQRLIHFSLTSPLFFFFFHFGSIIT